MAHGANPDGSSNFYNLTPLFCASSRSLGIVELLLISQRVDVNKLGHLGNSSLHEAVASGNKDIAETLIAAGIEKNLINVNGYTALDLADFNQRNNNLEMRTFLKALGCLNNPKNIIQPVETGCQCNCSIQ